VHHAVFCKYYAELTKKKKICLILGQTGSGVLSDPWPLCLSHHFFVILYITRVHCTNKNLDVPPKMKVKGYMYPQTKKPVGMLGVLCNSRYKGSNNWLCGSTSSAQSDNSRVGIYDHLNIWKQLDFKEDKKNFSDSNKINIYDRWYSFLVLTSILTCISQWIDLTPPKIKNVPSIKCLHQWCGPKVFSAINWYNWDSNMQLWFWCLCSRKTHILIFPIDVIVTFDFTFVSS
jgi:hypothetical protein